MMPTNFKNTEAYILQLPTERQVVMNKLRTIISKNLPKGFEEGILYNMIGYYVPHSLYPNGYHVNPKLPLPFINIASQKNFIALYHMGLYNDEMLLKWFKTEYPKYVKNKLDMGKSCIRLKKTETIPYQLIGELVSIITPKMWIERYEQAITK